LVFHSPSFCSRGANLISELRNEFSGNLNKWQILFWRKIIKRSTLIQIFGGKNPVEKKVVAKFPPSLMVFWGKVWLQACLTHSMVLYKSVAS
jgi:hypothetical protein